MRQIREMHQMRQISPTFFFGSSGGKSDAADPFLMVPMASFEICAKCVKSAQLFFFEPSGGKSDAADPFLMVPRASFEICAKCIKSAQLFFFGPSGGKSDAADPFLIVPRSSFEISGRHVSKCLGGNREAKSISHHFIQWCPFPSVLAPVWLDLSIGSPYEGWVWQAWAWRGLD